MRAGGARAKGNTFERQVSKLIVDAFAKYGITTKDCYRTPCSGGHMRASKEDPGDLVISKKLRKYFNFSVECKHYKDLDWHRLLSPEEHKGHWAEWWQQSSRSAMHVAGCFPLVIFRKNNGKPFVIYPCHPTISMFMTGDVPYPYLETRIKGTRVRVSLLDGFLDCMLRTLPSATKRKKTA